MKLKHLQIATSYAEALFSIAIKTNQLESIKNNFEILINSLEQNSEFYKIANNPLVNSQELLNLMSWVKEFDSDLYSLFAIVIDNKRLFLYKEIFDQYMVRYKKHNGIVDIDFVSERKLEPKELSEISEILKQKFNASAININNSVDKNILGGFIVKVGSKVIDFSLKSKIDNLEKNLLNQFY